MYKGDEADRTELQVGGGWSQPDGFFGQLSVRTQNFLGRGEAVGVSIQAGGVNDVYNLSYYVPWLLDRPQSVGVQLFQSNYDYTQTDGQQLIPKNRGATLTYGRSFGLFNNWSLAYTYSKQRNKRIVTIIPGTVLPPPVTYCTDTIVDLTYTQDCRYTVSQLRPSYSYDSLDSRLEPTRGAHIGASLDFTGGPLGGTKYYYRPEVDLHLVQAGHRLPDEERPRAQLLGRLDSRRCRATA